MHPIQYPLNLTEHERQEAEDAVYEEQVKVASNTTLCLGLFIAFTIIHVLLCTFFAMRGNYSVAEWLASFVKMRFLIIPLIFLFLHTLFFKYLRTIRLSTTYITNYDDYKKQSPFIVQANKNHRLLNIQSILLMSAVALLGISLFTPTLAMTLKVVAVVASALSLMLNVRVLNTMKSERLGN